MDISTAGMAATWAHAQAGMARQTLEIAMLRQQARAERTVVALLQASVEATEDARPAPDGQGQAIDIRI